MTKKTLQTTCVKCQEALPFELDTLKHQGLLICKKCGQQYEVSDPELAEQIDLFIELCDQIKKSEKILGISSVCVDVGPHCVEVPFKLLLTRLKSQLNLKIGTTELAVTYRVDPIQP